MLKNLLKDCKISRVENAAAAAQTELQTDVLDMSGFDAVCFIALLGDVTTGSVLTLTAKQNTANSVSSPTPTDVTDGDATFTAGASDADNKLLVVDVIRPAERYVFASLTRTTANAVVDGIIAIQYRTKDFPVTQPSSILASALSTPEA